jgi:glutamyl-tRNA synthetase
VVDHDADRYFFVPNPVLLPISGAPSTVAEAALYPNDPARGTRSLVFCGTVLLPAAEIREGVAMLRLKDLFNVQVSFEDGVPHLAYAGHDLAEARAAKAPIIQWLPIEAKIPCRLHQQQGDLIGYCEPGVRQKQGAVVQFERVGFARIDAVTSAGITAFFAHR